MTTQPLTEPDRWFPDQRGQGRGVRVSAHAEGGFLVVSTWRDGECVSTVRLSPEQAAGLVSGIAEGLAQLTEH